MAETSDDYYIICPHCGHKTRDDDYTVTEDPDVWECEPIICAISWPR